MAASSSNSFNLRISKNHCKKCTEATCLFPSWLTISGLWSSQRTFESFLDFQGEEYLYRSRCVECLPFGCKNCEEVRRFMYALDPCRTLKLSPEDIEDRVAAIKTYAQRRKIDVVFRDEVLGSPFQAHFVESMDIYFCPACRDTNNPMYCGDFRFKNRHLCVNCPVEEVDEEVEYEPVAQKYDNYFDSFDGGKIRRKRRRTVRKDDRVPKIAKDYMKEKQTGVKRTSKPTHRDKTQRYTQRSEVPDKATMENSKNILLDEYAWEVWTGSENLVYSDEDSYYPITRCTCCSHDKNFVGST